jgi:hypothetical protein
MSETDTYYLRIIGLARLVRAVAEPGKTQAPSQKYWNNLRFALVEFHKKDWHEKTEIHRKGSEVWRCEGVRYNQ